MVLRSTLSPRPVDSNTSKMYILENRASSRVSPSTIPYLSTNKESPSPAARKSGRCKVSFRDDVDQECCVFDPRFATNTITKCRSSFDTKVTQTTNTFDFKSFLKAKVFDKRLNNAAVKIQAQARRGMQHQRYLYILIAKVNAEIHAFYEKLAAKKREAAATTMQALSRGSMCRMHFQVIKLESRLLQSDRLLKTQLEDIQKDKAICEENTKKMEKTEQLPKGQDGDSLTSLEISQNCSSRSLDASSDSWRPENDNGEYDIGSRIYAEQGVEEEHTRKREERRREREEGKKKRMSEARSDITKARNDDRLERTFLWYQRMAMPSRKELKRQIATQGVDIASEDVDLLTWNKTGTRVANISTMIAMIRSRKLAKE
jgi:hypothetical protein